MSRRFEVTLHGTGFSVPVEGDKPIRGFFTIRRVVADTPEAAESKAIAALEQEERFQGLLEATEQKLGSRNGCRVRLESIGELSWFRWYFSRQSSSFIFFQDDQDNG
jgi:hypothetical protein